MFLTCHTLDLRSSSKHVALQNVSIYYTWKSIRKQYKNSKLKKRSSTSIDEFELPDGSYSLSDIQIILNLSSKA